eukprot:3295074-Prymnesium_polylepis.1
MACERRCRRPQKVDRMVQDYLHGALSEGVLAKVLATSVWQLLRLLWPRARLGLHSGPPHV